MIYPYANELPTARMTAEAFAGYNHNLRIGDNEFFEMANLSVEDYPVLSSRKPRGIYARPAAAAGLIGKDNLCWVDGSRFVVNGYPVEMGLTDGEKSLVSMGAYVVIFPDKKYINTKDLIDFGNLEAEYRSQGNVTFSVCTLDGEDYVIGDTGSVEPQEPENGVLWLDTGSKPHVLKEWSESSGQWVEIATTYVKIAAGGIGSAFREGDGVTIAGLEEQAEELQALNGSALIWSRTEDQIVVVGILDEVHTITAPVVVSRLLPEMDFVVESNNRLWGCRYGMARNGEIVNEIYASKLGDFKNWNCFQGISTDSYAVSLGSDGPFTGAINHLGYPCFFKEDCLHKIYGNYPANFQVQHTACQGVQRGSGKSLAIVGNVLYYKGRNGICAYDGSLPRDVSEKLGNVKYHAAVGGSLGSRYFCHMADEQNREKTFVLDTEKGMWTVETGDKPIVYCQNGDDLYYIDGNDGYIWSVEGKGDPEGPVRWSAETGILGLYTASSYGSSPMPEAKRITMLMLRLMMEPGSEAMKAYAEYDSSGIWEKLGEFRSYSLQSFTLPLRLRRCDHLRLRLVGSGGVKIFSITRVMEAGSASGARDGLTVGL